MRDNFFHRTCLLILSLGVWGCAAFPPTSPPGIYVMFRSDPPGAMFYSNGKNWGYTPVQLHYDTTDERFFGENGRYYQVKGGEVLWASGATQSIPLLRLDKQIGHYQEVMFRRPDVPGLDQDMRFALEVERNRLLKQQNDLQIFNAILNAPKPDSSPSTCISTGLGGGMISTQCY